FLAQVRMQLIQLPHLSFGTPAAIAVPRVSQVGLRNRLEVTRGVETSGQLICDALVLDETLLTRRAYRLLVQAHRIRFPPFQTGELGAEERRPMREILGAALCPEYDFIVMSPQLLQMIRPLFRC